MGISHELQQDITQLMHKLVMQTGKFTLSELIIASTRNNNGSSSWTSGLVLFVVTGSWRVFPTIDAQVGHADRQIYA